MFITLFIILFGTKISSSSCFSSVRNKFPKRFTNAQRFFVARRRKRYLLYLIPSCIFQSFPAQCPCFFLFPFSFFFFPLLPFFRQLSAPGDRNAEPLHILSVSNLFRLRYSICLFFFPPGAPLLSHPQHILWSFCRYTVDKIPIGATFLNKRQKIPSKCICFCNQSD